MTAQDDDKLNSIFKTAFSNFEESPPATVWDGVVSGLKHRKRVVLWWRLAAAASLIILLGLPLGYVINPWRNINELAEGKTDAIADQISVAPSGQLSMWATSTDSLLFATTAGETKTATTINGNPGTTSRSLHRGKLVKQPAANVVAPGLIDEKPVLAQQKEAANVSVVTDTKIAAGQPTSENEAVSTAGQLPPTKVLPANDFPLTDFNVIPDKQKTWQLAMGYGTTEGLLSSSADYLLSANKALFEQNTYINSLSFATGDFSDIEKTMHYQPLTLGITLSRQLSQRWAIESGLLFTRLGSTSKTYQTNDQWNVYKTELVYAGLPMAVRLNLLTRKRFFVYVSQGLVFEKGISADYQTKRYKNNKLVDIDSGSFDIHGFQFSTLTSLGVGLNLTKSLGIYLQPGLQVFMLNKTQPYNIRSNQMAWPALQAGLRVNL